MNKEASSTVNKFLERCRKNLQNHAGLLGNSLDPNLTPQIFLFAISTSDKEVYFAPPVLEEVVENATIEFRPVEVSHRGRLR